MRVVRIISTLAYVAFAILAVWLLFIDAESFAVLCIGIWFGVLASRDIRRRRS